MEPRKSKREYQNLKQYEDTGLSFGVANMDAKPLNHEGNKFLEFFMQIFLFFLGGIILCGMIFAVLTIEW